MDRHQKRDILFELLNIPEAEEILLLKAAELEITFGDKLAQYRDIKNHFRKTQRDNMLIFKNRRPVEKLQSYSFELKRIAQRSAEVGYRWVIDRIEPKPTEPAEKVIPVEFFSTITYWNPSPHKIESLTGFKSESLNERFDITFTKCSKSHVVGNIRRHRKRRTVAPDSDTGSVQSRTHFGDSGPERNEDYLELYRYMEQYSYIRKHVFSLFTLVLKPSVGKVETIR